MRVLRPSPRSHVLGRPDLGILTEFAGGAEPEVGVAQPFAPGQHDVGVARLEHLLGLRAARDLADRADERAGATANGGGEGDLVAGARRDPGFGDESAAGDVERGHTALDEPPADLNWGESFMFRACIRALS